MPSKLRFMFRTAKESVCSSVSSLPSTTGRRLLIAPGTLASISAAVFGGTAGAGITDERFALVGGVSRDWLAATLTASPIPQNSTRNRAAIFSFVRNIAESTPWVRLETVVGRLAAAPVANSAAFFNVDV